MNKMNYDKSFLKSSTLNKILKNPLYQSFFITLFLAIIFLPYWWFTVLWSYTILTSPEVIFTFITTTFLLVLIILDSIFLIRYYQLKDKIELKKKKEELVKSEELYRSIIKASPDGIAISDKQGTLDLISPSAVSMFGGNSENEFIGRNLLDFLHPEDVPKAAEKFSMLLAGEKQNVYPLRSKRIDGTIFPNEIHSDIIRDQDGNPREIITVFRDITEREKILAQIKENEKIFRSIFEDISDPLLMLDENGKILDINRNCENEMHIIKDRHLGSDIISCGLFSDESKDKIRSFIKNAENVKTLEDHIHYPDGQDRFVILKVSMLRIRGNKVLLLLIQDIDEIKRAKNALAKANNKINLLNNITRHDIINRITVGNAYCDFLKEIITDEKARNQIDIILESGKNVQQLIDFSKEYQDLGGEEPIWQDINYIVSKNVFKPLILNKSLILPKDTVEIFADTMLEKVFYNLIENSIRHGEHVSCIQILYKKNGDSLNIIYSDDGVGVPYEEKPKIFRRGYGKNTGLGLFLIREILGITNITIEENGEPGKGIQFVLTVPHNCYRSRKETDFDKA